MSLYVSIDGSLAQKKERHLNCRCEFLDLFFSFSFWLYVELLMSPLNTDTPAAIIDAPLVYLQTLRVQYKKDTNKESHTGPGAEWTSQVHIKGSQDELEYFHNNTATRDGPIREIHVMPNRPAPALADKHLQWTCPMVNWGEDEAVIATGNWWMFSTAECGLKAPTWKTEQSRQDGPELSRDWIQRNCLFFSRGRL